MVIGPAMSEDDRQPLAVDDGLITFHILDQRLQMRVILMQKLTRGWQIFPGLLEVTFCDYHLSIKTKRPLCTVNSSIWQ